MAKDARDLDRGQSSRCPGILERNLSEVAISMVDLTVAAATLVKKERATTIALMMVAVTI